MIGNVMNEIVSKIAPAQAFPSIILSLYDETPTPKYLIKKSIELISNSFELDLKDITERLPEPPYYTDVWPGECYNILAGAVKTFNPKVVIDFGTAGGLSALTLKKFLSEDGKVFTFDIIPWQKYPTDPIYPRVVLRRRDFFDKRLFQYVEDLSDEKVFEKHIDIIKEAELIFVDGPKDEVTEKKLLKNFQSVDFKHEPYIIMDDIKFLNMLEIWRSIKKPKIDLTSFGHWSGTGLIHWTKD